MNKIKVKDFLVGDIVCATRKGDKYKIYLLVRRVDEKEVIFQTLCISDILLSRFDNFDIKQCNYFLEVIARG